MRALTRLSRAIACVLLVAGTVTVASAHDSSPGARLRFDRIEPAVPRLFVVVREVLAPIVQVRNDTGERFEAIGSDGIPFLRVTGVVVEANLASPDWYRSESPSPAGWVAPTARAGAKPRWVRIGDGDGWAWFEHRIGASGRAPGSVWSIPARIGGRPIVIHGAWVSAQIRGSFRSTLDAVSSDVGAGLDVRILQGTQPAIFVSNTTGKVLEITGRRDEPFLRIGPAGAEQADASGTYVKLGAAPRWAWVEPRAGWGGEDPPESALRSTTTVTLGTWGIPATLDGRPIVISGRVEWVPVAGHHQPVLGRGSSTAPLIAAGAGAALIVAIVAAWTIHRRRRRAASLSV
jgi:hypothetical protein